MSRTRDFADLINGISAAKITSGSLDAARLSNIDSDYVQLRQATADLTNLNASNLASGTIPNDRYGTPTFNGSNITNIAAMSSSPTQGTWTPSFSSGSFDNITGKYQKFGQIVYCQAEFRMTAEAADNTGIYTFGGLPFTSISYSSGGGYNNQWFVGTGRWYYHSGANVALWVRDNSTSFHPSQTGNSAYRLTRYYGTYDKGGFINAEMANEKFLYDTNSDRRWGWFDFCYISAS